MPKMPEKKTYGDMGSLVVKCKVCDGSGKIKAKKTEPNKGEFWNPWS